jgi:hypothetical protein
MIVPAAAACTAVPLGTAMSIPSCIPPQRGPKPLTTGPETGQMSPLEETPEPELPLDPLDPLDPLELACEARI